MVYKQHKSLVSLVEGHTPTFARSGRSTTVKEAEASNASAGASASTNRTQDSASYARDRASASTTATAASVNNEGRFTSIREHNKQRKLSSKQDFQGFLATKEGRLPSSPSEQE
jgi:hypothetical protein